MKSFEIEVTQIVKVTIDETKFDEKFMDEFRQSFFDFDTLEEHAAHIAQLKARGLHDFHWDRTEFVEGYGPVGDMGITAEVTDTETGVL